MAEISKEQIISELKEDIPLTWEEFRRKFCDHKEFIEKGKIYYDKNGESLRFDSYDPIYGKVKIFQGTSSEGQTMSIRTFENMLASCRPKEDDPSSKVNDPEDKKGLRLPVDKETDPAKAGTLHALYKLNENPDLTVADLVPEDRIKVTRDAKGQIERMDIDYDPDKATPEEKVEMNRVMDEKINELSRKLWDLLVTHGYAEEQEDGTYKMTKHVSDLDGESCLELCRLAGLDTSKVKYVPQGEGGKEEGFVMDTSDTDGIIAKEGGKTFIADHHGKESGRDTSATKHVYQILVENGLLAKEKYLDDYVDFVTQEDNKTYYEEDIKKNFKESWRSLRGLSYYIGPTEIIRFFKEGVESGKPFDPDAPLPEEYLKNHKYQSRVPGDKNHEKTLNQLAYKVREKIKYSLEGITDLEKAGLVFDTGKENFGKILVDPGKDYKGGRIKYVPLGHDAARSVGYGGYLSWSPESNGFALFTTRPLKDIELTQGKNVRGNFIVKFKGKEPLKVTLNEIFSKLSRKEIELSKKLQSLEAEVDAVTSQDVKNNEEKDDIEKEIDPEKWGWMQKTIENLSRDAKKYLDELKDMKIIPSDKSEEEKIVDEFLESGISYSRHRFNEEEIKYIIGKTKEAILSH